MQDLNAVAAMTSLAPRFQKRRAVMMVRRDLDLVRSSVLDSDFDAALALMSAPNGIVEAELHLLFDIAWKVVRSDPAGMDVEGGFTAIRVSIADLELNRVPSRSGRGSHQAALAGGANAGQPPIGAEGEINQLDVMHRHVGPRVSTGDPLGKLPAADLFGLQEGTIAVVDVLEQSVDDVSPKLLMVGIRQFVIDHF